MPVIRINKAHYELLKELSIKEDRPISRIIARLLTEALKPTTKAKKVHPLFDPLKQIYCENWRINNGMDYRWNGVIDSSALNRLIKTLTAINNSEHTIDDLFSAIMTNLPPFYKDKTINAINKNINGIIADIKNRGNKAKEVPNIGTFDFRN